MNIQFKIPKYNTGRVIMLETLKEDLEWVDVGSKEHKILKLKIRTLHDINHKYTTKQRYKKLH